MCTYVLESKNTHMLGLLPLMCSKWTAPTIDYWQPPLLNELELVATNVDNKARRVAMDAYKRGMLLESKMCRGL
jgi:hypothetical protein